MKKHLTTNGSIRINGTEIRTNSSGNCYSDSNSNIIIGDDEININGNNNIVISGDDDIIIGNSNSPTFTTERRAKILIAMLLLIAIAETLFFTYINTVIKIPLYMNVLAITGILCQVRSIMNIRRQQGNHWSTIWLLMATIVAGGNAVLKIFAGETPAKIATILVIIAATVASATIIVYRIIIHMLQKNTKPDEK